MTAPRHLTIEELLNELERANPDRQPFITYPRTREQADEAEAERRKEERRAG